MTKRKLRKELSEFSRKTEPTATLYSGSLGIYIGGTQYVDVPNRPGFVYVRLRNNISELIQAHNEVVSPVYGLPVLLIRNKTYYEIYGRDSVQYGSYWDSSSSYLPKHGHQHEFDPDNNGGGDLVFVHGEQFYPMMTFPSGSDGGNTVLIAPYRYFYQGLWHYTGNTGVGDLLQYGPTGANNAKLLLVGTTSATGNPFVKQGSEFSEGITGAAALTSFVPTNITPIDEIPGAIIRLVTGTQTITWANIYDARQYMGILQAGSGSSGGATDFLGLSDTPNSYAGQADKLVVVNSAANALEFRTSTGTSGGGSHILNVVDDLAGLTSGDNNNYAPTGYDSITDVIIIYGDADNTSRITGITGGVNGRKLTIINGADNRVTISSSGGGSSAGNTIETNSSDGISIRTYEAVSLIWYTSLGEWVIVDDHKIRDTFWIDSTITGTVTANQNDWALSIFDEKAVFLMSPTADRDITGISSANGTKHGQVLTFVNINSSFTLTFKNESGSSAAENRFSMGADLAVGPGKSATFWYDKFAQRWRNTSSTVSGSIPTGTPHSFLDLTDTPDSYSGQGSKYVAVNSGGTALEFVTAPAGGGGGGSGLVVYDDSVYKVTGTAISFDSNLSVAITGSVAFVSASASTTGRTLIATSLPSGTTVTFSSFPSTYKKLEIDYVARSSKAASTFEEMDIQFNSDTTATNYRFARHGAYGTNSSSAETGDSYHIAQIPAASSPTNSAGAGTISIPFYAAGAFNKQVLSLVGLRFDNTSNHEMTSNYAIEWENAAAITQIDIKLPSGNFVTGTTFCLYGLS